MNNCNKSRRKFISNSLILSAAIPLISSGFLSCIPKKDEGLNILILGGTSFLGPHQIAYALSRGHKVSIFTRGKTKPTVHKDVFNKVEHLIGDRENDLSALKNRKWDAVIDNSGRKVQWTKDTAELLKDNVEFYLYTSSTGVYYPYLMPNIKEDRELVLKLPENATENQKYEYEYGIMKANSENIAKVIFGEERTIVVRPTYMMGPGDKTDRFTHWPVRLSQGGAILVPGKADDPVQYIDVRDVAEWMIRLIETQTSGTFNAVGPKEKTGMYQFVKEAHSAFNSEANFIYIDDYDFLAENGIYFAVPWIPPIGNNACTALVNNEKALANGLIYRSLTQSCKDIVDWWNTDAVSEKQRENLANGQYALMRVEKQAIENWKALKNRN